MLQNIKNLEIHLQVLRDNRALSRLFVIFLYNKQ